MTGVAAVALGVGSVVARRARLDPVVVVIALVATLVAPLAAGSGAFLSWAVVRFVRAARRSRDQRELDLAVLEVGDLVGLGLAGGLSTASAWSAARDHCRPALDADLERLIASMARRGVVPALEVERGPLSGIAAAVGAATASGAPVLPALDAYLRHEHHGRHIERVEAARRLPIRLLVPLTLLVLPGFVLITVGPAIVDSLARLSP